MALELAGIIGPEMIAARLRAMADDLESGPPSRVVAPSPEDLMVIINGALLPELSSILYQRGKSYGEEVLVVMGEQGIAEMAKVKIYRMLAAIAEGTGSASTTRRDSWLDMAGYALLALALDEWERSLDTWRETR